MLFRYLMILICCWGLIACTSEAPLSYNAHIRPIFNAKCVSCHGGVKQAGGFGLVFREDALVETSTGKRAIVPGKPGQSELLRRIQHKDPELRMPLDGGPLTKEEVRLIHQWIEEGAQWEEHWAYLPVVRPEVPELDSPTENPIDAFIRIRLQKDSLAPAAAPEKQELLRRLSLDLTGLPPSPELLRRYVENKEEMAYEELVDRLLASPSFGEHWASSWLDLARYADSRGYERDQSRSIWQYRDWVIRSFNEDMPYDAFARNQLAGDLLPEPTHEQRLATAFHRNSLSNDEGGTDNEEYRVVTVIDRVNTTWEAFLGTTMACVQCHGHPYDPLRQKAFYQSYAVFNNTADHDHVTEAPYLITYREKDEEKARKLEDWVREYGEEEARTQVQKWAEMIRVREPRIRPYQFTEVVNGVFTDRGDEDWMFLTDGASLRLPPQDLTGIAALHLNYRLYKPTRVEVRLGSLDGPVVGEEFLDEGGWSYNYHRIHLQPSTENQALYLRFYGKDEGRLLGLYGVLYQEKLPGATEPGYVEIEAFIDDLLMAKDSVRTPVMAELAPISRRTTTVFQRGNWMVTGDTVVPGVAAIFPEMETSADPRKDRLAFANWMVSRDNPLFARVAVNRFWAAIFGRGIVETTEDFGSQGALPTHPELLDWLAATFSEDLAWQPKALIRLLVTSETYRQSAEITPELLTYDPHNRLLARAPRKRLAAEQVRDQVLSVSGLLSDKMYGPGVMPPQPEGLWDGVPYSGMRWQTSTGEDRYRRAVYTYLRRSVPHPSLTTFDGSNRQACLSRRVETNTPLQALMTLNDPAVLECAVFLAKDLAKRFETTEAQIDGLLQRTLFRKPTVTENESFVALYQEALADYQTKPMAAEALTGVAAPELAALTLVVNAAFNLDAFLTT